MNYVKIYTEILLSHIGVSTSYIPLVRHVILVLITVGLAAFAGWLFSLFIPLVLRVTKKTAARWDDVMFNVNVLRSACQIVPAVVVWLLLPSVFSEYPTAHEIMARLTAIYITVMSVRTLIVLFNSLHLLEGEKRTSRQQYLYSFAGILKIVLIFVAAIIVMAIALDKDPSTLFAGLGAASAILMLAFQDTIKGLVAGVRLTSNDMLHIGDRITVPSAGADGIVEEITLTTVKVRNFDNTIITVTPQTLVDGSFQNWLGMEQSGGRKVCQLVYYDFRKIGIVDDAMRSKLLDHGLCAADELTPDAVNMTLFRRYIERWLAAHELVNPDMPILVKNAGATQAGLAVEFNFFLKEKAGIPYSRQSSDLMDYIYAVSEQFGLHIYQQFPEQ